MYPGNFYMSNMSMPRFAITPNMGGFNSRNIGLLGRFSQGLRQFNISKFLNGANRTLNIMNQAIPLVRDAKPFFNNMKSVFKLAKAFTNETSNNSVRDVNKNFTNNLDNSNIISKIDSQEDNFPTFFI